MVMPQNSRREDCLPAAGSFTSTESRSVDEKRANLISGQRALSAGERGRDFGAQKDPTGQSVERDKAVGERRSTRRK
jgi:hypothetical protein